MLDRYLHLQPCPPKSCARRPPFTGSGKQEPLKGSLSGFWFRRISHEHRLVYRIAGKADEQHIEIAACRFHYGEAD